MNPSHRKVYIFRIGVVIFLTAALAVIIFLNPKPWLFTFMGIVGIGVYLLVRWHSRSTIYTCPDCQHVFTISTGIDFLSPHSGTTKWLICPSCQQVNWCRAELKKTKHDIR
ncbi:MAG: hypothetical protein GF307_12010 [candidate division Zixibacteria bacterium]|nr:hypothetical protein [candidate division Zixibacteria bacterium]